MSELDESEMPGYYFIDIKKLPPDLMDHNPLAASLQTLETAFIMIAHDRFPAALVMIASAIESVNKAKLVIAEGVVIEAPKLFKLIQGHYDKKRSDWSDWSEPYRLFCNKRNNIIHYGYTPESKEECAELLVKTGLPLLSNLYEALFNIRLSCPKKRPQTILHSRVAEMWDAYPKILQLEVDSKNPIFSNSLLPLGRLIKWALEPEYDWTTDSNWEREQELLEKMGLHNGKSIGLDQLFECPICNGDTFVCQISSDDLDKKSVSLVEGRCVRCELRISDQQSFVLDVLMENQVIKAAPGILKDFGIK
jgi:hypothetical protein